MKNRGGQLSPSVSIKQQQLGLRLPMRPRAERQRKEEAVSAFLTKAAGAHAHVNGHTRKVMPLEKTPWKVESQVPVMT